MVASSNHAADWYEHLIHVGKMDVVDPDLTPPKSDNYYGWPKCSTGRRFSLGARRSAVPSSDRPVGIVPFPCGRYACPNHGDDRASQRPRATRSVPGRHGRMTSTDARKMRTPASVARSSGWKS